MNALGLLNAQLELRFELIRAITPKYAQYKYTKSPQFEAYTSDNSEVTKVLKMVSKTAQKWTNIDVDKAARKARVDRGDVVRKLQEWHNRGAVELQPSGVINRFRVLNKFPETEEGKREIVKAIHTYFETSERDGMAKVHGVIGLITAKACLSRSLAKHFGDEDSVPKEGCGHCSFCLTGKPIMFDQARNRSRKGLINKKKLKAILTATNVRDDPRFLARVAFGISSPRVTKERLGKHAVFGSMDDCDFDVGSILSTLSTRLKFRPRSSSSNLHKPVTRKEYNSVLTSSVSKCVIRSIFVEGAIALQATNLVERILFSIDQLRPFFILITSSATHLHSPHMPTPHKTSIYHTRRLSHPNMFWQKLAISREREGPSPQIIILVRYGSLT